MVARANRKQFKLVMPVVPEHSIQRTLTKVLTLEIAPPGKLSKFGVVWFSVDHANYAGEVPGVRVGRGMIAGVPDTFFLYRGKCHLIELKSEDGALTDEQEAVIAAARLAGCDVAVCDKMEQVLRALDTWGVPRKRRLMFPVPEEDAA
jgi:hypothetical protein